MSLTIIVGQPGSGKSKTIRDRYLQASGDAVFLDGHHSEEAVRQLRHEMGFFDHRYLYCAPEALWPELERLDGEREIFIDMPDLPFGELHQLQRLARERQWHFTVTARSVPPDLQGAEVINL
ncbi:MAG: hypothetical protein ACM3ZC_17360 [Bacteroidota bacterium]